MVEIKKSFYVSFSLTTIRECWDPKFYVINTIISDAYSAYPPGIAKVEELIGHKITYAGCFAHLRRYFLDALRLMKLDRVFLNICHCQIIEYDKVRDEEVKRQGIKIGQNGLLVMELAYIVELILTLDGDFDIVDNESLSARRKRSSKPLMDRFYRKCEVLLNRTPNMEVYTDTLGINRVKGGLEHPWVKALSYALNNKDPLTEFLDNPDIGC